MTREELLNLLKRHEWRDVEFKAARRDVPKDAWKTVSAFANTEGGYLVFGVQERDGRLEIVGVIEVDKVQNDFLSCLRGGEKLSRVISANEELIEHAEKTLLVFFIPESHRTEKPIYLDGNPKQAFVRRGGCDEKCTPPELERFLRDSADTTYDRMLLKDMDAEEFYEPRTVAWYRRIFLEKQGNRQADLSDLEFLHEWGLVVEADGALVPTRAAVLLFGRGRYVRQVLPRGVVDYQRIDIPESDWSPEQRWHDRAVVEENILEAWQVLVDKYGRLAEKPFSVDSATMRRHDEPPDYISFREAAINLLIHQDYGDHTRLPVIKLFPERTRFWNPGDAFSSVEELLEPTEKEVRNPAIVSAFRRIGLSDQAGTGIRAINGNWRQLGYVPPIIKNDKAGKSFALELSKEVLLTDAQRLFQAQLGVHLTEQEAATFALACRQGTLQLVDVKGVINRGARDALAVLERLVVQGLLRCVQPEGPWEVAPHLRGHPVIGGNGPTVGDHAPRGLNVEAAADGDPDLVSDQVGAMRGDLVSDQAPNAGKNLVSDQAQAPHVNLVTPILTELTEHQRTIVRLCEVPRSQADLMEACGVTHRTFFRRKHLEPLVRANLLNMTHADEPNHPQQAYVVTDGGLKLIMSLGNKG